MAKAIPTIPFIDLQAQRQRLAGRIEEAIAAVLDHGRFILGPEVTDLETGLTEFCGARFAITCASGTDALALCLMARELGPGQAVFVPSFTFAATAEVVAWCGAVPFFVDVRRDTFNMDADSLARSIKAARGQGLEPAGVIAVDLFGQPADYDAIEPLCDKHGLWLLSDAAQSFGASYRGRRVGTIGDFTATSFYPAKPLGCYGDGGAVFTDDEETAEVLRSLRVHGEGTDRYDNVRVGMNGRMDSIQAAVLIQKLSIFADEVEARDRVARLYTDGLADIVETPALIAGAASVWAQYTIRLGGRDRVALAERLRSVGVPTAVYYPKGLHEQTAYRHYPADPKGLRVTAALTPDVISLPIHPYLDTAQQDRIIDAVRQALVA